MLTPYARAHIRLAQIHQRWLEVRARRGNQPLHIKGKWRQAQAEANYAMAVLEDDMDMFDDALINPDHLEKP